MRVRKITQKKLRRIMEDQYGTICMGHAVTGKTYSMKQMIRWFAKAIVDDIKQ